MRVPMVCRIVAALAWLTLSCSGAGPLERQESGDVRHSGDFAGDPTGDPIAGDAGDPIAGDPSAGDSGDPSAGDPMAGDSGDPAGDPRPGDPQPGDPRAGDPTAGDPGTSLPPCEDVETLHAPTGPQTYHLVMTSEGYAPDASSLFCADARQMTAAVLEQEPFASHAEGIRITSFWIESQDQGLQDTYIWQSGGWVLQPSGKSTAFASALYVGRYIIEINNYLPLLDAQAAVGGTADDIVVVINSVEYGGTGRFRDSLPAVAYWAHVGTPDEISWTNAQAWFQFGLTVGTTQLGDVSGERVMIHELGHSIVNLGEEYFNAAAVYPSDDPVLDGYIDVKPNVSRTNDPATVKWSDLIGVDGVGIFEGADGYGIGLYRPWDTACIMRSEGNARFCPVCAGALELELGGP